MGIDGRSATLGAVVGAAAAAALITLSGRRAREAPADAPAGARDALERHPCARRGLPRTSSVHAGDAFVSSFDFRTRNPAWVIERLPGDSWIQDDSTPRPRRHQGDTSATPW